MFSCSDFKIKNCAARQIYFPPIFLIVRSWKPLFAVIGSLSMLFALVLFSPYLDIIIFLHQGFCCTTLHSPPLERTHWRCNHQLFPYWEASCDVIKPVRDSWQTWRLFQACKKHALPSWASCHCLSHCVVLAARRQGSGGPMSTTWYHIKYPLIWVPLVEKHCSTWIILANQLLCYE